MHDDLKSTNASLDDNRLLLRLKLSVDRITVYTGIKACASLHATGQPVQCRLQQEETSVGAALAKGMVIVD